jgi:surface polysaccharide O-acyltransferase-like enzyme
MNKPTRIQSLDILRGIAIIFIILFHSSIYNFANIHKLDFSNPPIIIILMSFMALWGGIFIIYSMVVNSYMLIGRLKQNQSTKIFSHLAIVSLLLLVTHYILNIFLGRWNVDFVNNQPDMTFVASTLRNMTLTFPHITKFFEGSSLSTIALNLLFLTTLLYFLFKDNGMEKKNRNYLILASSGFFIMLFSFIRVSLYHLFDESIATNNYLLSLVYSFVLNNPYPLLPYLAYGCFGTLIGLLIFEQRRDLLKKIILPTGLFFIAFGIIGMMNFEKTISKPDYFWFFKTNFELGIFLLLIPGIYLLLESRKYILCKLTFLKWFSGISLTIYLSETLISEILRIIITPIVPSWNQTINGCLLFGTFNIIIWFIILFFWKKADFKYSLEYFWVKLFKRLNKESTKMSFEK